MFPLRSTVESGCVLGVIALWLSPIVAPVAVSGPDPCPLGTVQTEGPLDSQSHGCFSRACQFSTTVMGAEFSSSALTFTRKRWPSRVTAY